MGNLTYGSYEPEAAKQDADDAANSDGKNFFKLKEGRNVLRILPPPAGVRSPFRVVYQHFVESNGKRGSLVCARTEAKKPCAVCSKVDELRNSNAKADQDLSSDLYARRRVFANVIDRKDEGSGPKILGMGKKIHEQLLAIRNDADAGGDFCHPIEGFDVVITRKGTGKNDTEYMVSAARNASQLHDDEDQMQEWIDSQLDLSTLARLPSAADVGKLMGTDEEDEAPQRPRLAAGSSSGRVRPAASTTSRAPTQTKPRRTAEDDAEDTEETEEA